MNVGCTTKCTGEWGISPVKKQTRKSLILKGQNKERGYSLPAPQAEVPVIIITAVLIARLQPDYLIPDALEERHCQC